MEDQVHYLTPEGLEKLKSELQFLTQVKRQEIADRLQFAIAQGDISENADYEVAKQDLGFNEGRIKELEEILFMAKIIQVNESTDSVQIGSKVTIAEEGCSPETYTIVGPAEASPTNGRISHRSPVGAALLGLGVGDIARIKTPGGAIEMVIQNIE